VIYRRENLFPQISGRFLTAAVSLLSVTVFILFTSGDPSASVRYFFTGPFLNRYFTGNMINSAVPLIFSGLGISIAFRAAQFNLGGEGQIYAGAVTAAAVCLAVPRASGGAGILLALLAAGLAAGGLAAVSGFLKARWDVNSMISSFLISGAVVYIADYIITVVLDDPSSSLLATGTIGKQFFLPLLLPPSRLNMSMVFAVVFTAVSAAAVYFTRWGFELRMTGLSREFAEYSGIGTSGYITGPFFVSGFLHGLGGGFAVLGTYHMAIKGFTAGTGWSGIAVALLSGNNPLFVIPAALFIAYLKAGANTAMQFSDVTSDIAAVAESIVYFLITAEAVYMISDKFKRRKG